MAAFPNTLIDRYLPKRRAFELMFWALFVVFNTSANVAVALIELRRDEPGFPAWPPIVWESSSTLLMLVLLPAVIWFTGWMPVQWSNWRRWLPGYVLASVVFSLVHVAGMVWLRQLAYAWMGESYDFGPLPREALYEYLKDVRSFATIVAIIEVYRFVLRRLQGEASLLGLPDDGLPVEPVERPDRFLVRKLGREFLVSASDIEWIQASGNYVNLHVKGRDYPLRSTIAGIGERLDPRRFVRVQRSYIVNLDQIESMEPLETGDARLHMKGNASIPCSRRFRAGLKERIESSESGVFA